MVALRKAGGEGRELVRVLREVITPGAVMGPVSVKNMVMIPIVQVSIGVGSGGPTEGGRGSARCGGSITPVALVVIFKGSLALRALRSST